MTRLSTFLTQRRAVDLCRVRSSLCRASSDRR
ncbi:putative leader peptide [Amycolatopsis sp. SID8362]